MKEWVRHIFDNPKTQAAGATFTTTAGLSTFFNYIPDMLGVIATVMGIIFTWSMICKGRLERKKVKLEINLMKKEIQCKECTDNRRQNDS